MIEMKSGKSDAIINKNIKMLMENGYSKVDAVAMAYSKAKKKRPRFISASQIPG